MANTENPQPNNGPQEQKAPAKVDLRGMDYRKRALEILNRNNELLSDELLTKIEDAQEKYREAQQNGDSSMAVDLERQIRQMQAEFDQTGKESFDRRYVDGELIMADLLEVVGSKLDTKVSKKAIDMFFNRSAIAGGIENRVEENIPNNTRKRGRAKKSKEGVGIAINVIGDSREKTWGEKISSISFKDIKEVFVTSKEELDRRYDVVKEALYEICDKEMHVIDGETPEEKMQSFEAFVKSAMSEINPVLTQQAMDHKKLLTLESGVKTTLTLATVASAFTPASIFAVPTSMLVSWGANKFFDWRNKKLKERGLDEVSLEKKKRRVLKNEGSSSIFSEIFFQKIGDSYEALATNKLGGELDRGVDLSLARSVLDKLGATEEVKTDVISALVGAGAMKTINEKMIADMVAKNSGTESKIAKFNAEIGSRENSFWLDKVPFVARWVTFGAIASRKISPEWFEKVVSDNTFDMSIPLLRAVMGGIAGYKLGDRLNIALARRGLVKDIRGLNLDVLKKIRDISSVESDEDIDKVLGNVEDRAKVKNFILSEIAEISQKKNLNARDYKKIEQNKRILEKVDSAELRNYRKINNAVQNIVNASDEYENAVNGLVQVVGERAVFLRQYQRNLDTEIDQAISSRSEKFKSRKNKFKVAGFIVGALTPFIIRKFLGSSSNESSDANHRASALGDDASNHHEASSLAKDEISEADSSVEGAGEKEASSVDRAEHEVKKGMIPSKEVAVEDAVAGPKEFKWEDIDKSAVVKKNEGVWHAVKRQIEGDEEIRKALGLTESATKDEINRATAKLLVDNDYIKPDHTEVRVLKADAVAYDAKVVDGKVIISELHSLDGKVAEGTTGIDKAFEYSYKKPIEPVELAQVTSNTESAFSNYGEVRTFLGEGSVGIGGYGDSDAIYLYDSADGKLSVSELSGSLSSEDSLKLARDISLLDDRDSVNSFMSRTADAGFTREAFAGNLATLNAEQMASFENTYNMQGFDNVSLRLGVNRDVLFDFARDYNRNTLDIMQMIHGDIPVPRGSEKLIQAARAIFAERLESQPGTDFDYIVSGVTIDEINRKGLLSFVNDNYTGQKLINSSEFHSIVDANLDNAETPPLTADSIEPAISSGAGEAITEKMEPIGIRPEAKVMVQQIFDIDNSEMNNMLSDKEIFDGKFAGIGDAELRNHFSSALKEFQGRAGVVEQLQERGVKNIPGFNDFKIISDPSAHSNGEVYKSLFNLMSQEKALDKVLEENGLKGFTQNIDFTDLENKKVNIDDAERRKRIWSRSGGM